MAKKKEKVIKIKEINNKGNEMVTIESDSELLIQVWDEYGRGWLTLGGSQLRIQAFAEASKEVMTR